MSVTAAVPQPRHAPPSNLTTIKTRSSSTTNPRLKPTSTSSSTSTSTSNLAPSNLILSPLSLIPPVPPLPSDPAKHSLSQRPKTAPGLPLVQHPDTPPELSSFAASRTRVRKAPTLSNLTDLAGAVRPKSRGLTKAIKPSLLSPTEPPRPTTSASDRRPSSSRRPPASFSANGIETSFGPPPALITRNSSYASDIFRAQNPNQPAALAYHSPSSPGASPNSANNSTSSPSFSNHNIAQSIQSYHHHHHHQTTRTLFSPPSPSSPLEPKHMESLDAMVKRNQTSWSQHLSTPDAGRQYDHQSSDGGLESGQSSEDLFLDLGNDQTANSGMGDLTARLDHFTVRGNRSSQRPSSRGAQSSYVARRNSSPAESAFASQKSKYNNQNPSHKLPSSAASVIGASNSRPASISAEQRLNSFRQRLAAVNNTPSMVSGSSDGYSTNQRRASITDSIIHQHQQRSSKLQNEIESDQYLRPNRASGHHHHHHHHDLRLDTADSTSTSHSAVWDDLPEMKSHVSKQSHGALFHTGGIISNSSQDRPHTATTTVTTMSSSPKHLMGMKYGERKLSDELANLHPLLHQSLARCKPIIHAILYRSLENAASDALEMAMWSRTSGPNGSIYSTASAINGISSDGQLRRKADNMCRNLTDLCIALAENSEQANLNQLTSPSSFQSRRQSRDFSNTTLTQHSLAPDTRSAFSRQASAEPEFEPVTQARPIASRALERVEARRSSYISTGTPPSGSPMGLTPTTQLYHAPSAIPSRNNHLEIRKNSPHTPTTSSNYRSGTSFLRTRHASNANVQLEDDSHLIRPLSRANTEINATYRKRSEHRPTSLIATEHQTYAAQQSPLTNSFNISQHQPLYQPQYQHQQQHQSLSQQPQPQQPQYSYLHEQQQQQPQQQQQHLPRLNTQTSPYRRVTGSNNLNSPSNASSTNYIRPPASRFLSDRESTVQTRTDEDNKSKRRSLGLYSTAGSTVGTPSTTAERGYSVLERVTSLARKKRNSGTAASIIAGE